MRPFGASHKVLLFLATHQEDVAKELVVGTTMATVLPAMATVFAILPILLRLCVFFLVLLILLSVYGRRFLSSIVLLDWKSVQFTHYGFLGQAISFVVPLSDIDPASLSESGGNLYFRIKNRYYFVCLGLTAGTFFIL